MSSLQILDIKKSYGATKVIHGVSFDIADGEFVILVGPSGCGKSTLLRMIAGLESVTDGTISIDGKVVNRLEPKDRDIAMVFQNYALYPQMTVAQNMGFALELAGKSKVEIARQVDQAAAILGLQPLLDRKPAQLSGGQRQRVAMGRAIVRDPKVFLFDEPLSNLDAKLRVQMRTEIKALHARLGTTIVYVTHDQIEAMTMADKIVVMNAGQVEQVGPPLELYDKPNNVFVAGFLGSPAMNLLRGVLEVGDQTAIRLADGSLAPVRRVTAEHSGSAVTFGVRPEHVSIVQDGGIGAKVLTVEPTGSETHLVLDLAGTEVTAVSKDRLDVEAGQDVHISLSSERTHFFDPEHGRRLSW